MLLNQDTLKLLKIRINVCRNRNGNAMVQLGFPHFWFIKTLYITSIFKAAHYGVKKIFEPNWSTVGKY